MIPTDVPIHRPSVGAMKVTQGVEVEGYVFKPYVYRGKGYDIYDDEWTEKLKRRWTDDQRKTAQKRRSEKRKVEEARYREEWRKRKVENEIFWSKKRAEHERAKRWTIEARANRYRMKPAPRNIRPAQGWSPTTGEDIEKILDEIGES